MKSLPFYILILPAPQAGFGFQDDHMMLSQCWPHFVVLVLPLSCFRILHDSSEYQWRFSLVLTFMCLYNPRDGSDFEEVRQSIWGLFGVQFSPTKYVCSILYWKRFQIASAFLFWKCFHVEKHQKVKRSYLRKSRSPACIHYQCCEMHWSPHYATRF